MQRYKHKIIISIYGAESIFIEVISDNHGKVPQVVGASFSHCSCLCRSHPVVCLTSAPLGSPCGRERNHNGKSLLSNIPEMFNSTEIIS